MSEKIIEPVPFAIQRPGGPAGEDLMEVVEKMAAHQGAMLESTERLITIVEDLARRVTALEGER